ncbi:TonB family protein [Sphingomonas sp. RB3P16]|uniref:energy transducer TonB n=1 Tax=Parasphingomonas frigoris TaxID=3096163 RepID=UPI002FC62778
MYADRYANRHGLNPGGVAFALGTSAVLLFGLSLTAPHFLPNVVPTITATNIPLDPPPPPKPEPKPTPEIRQAAQPLKPRPESIDLTKPIVASNPSGPIATHVDPPPLQPIAGGTGDGGTIVTPPAPILTLPRLDSRYASAFQPVYPSDERLAGREGRVVVRVLIGADGRVKQVEPVSPLSPAFYDATRKRALEKWRFTPATRDGVAVEAWQTMAVRFVLDEE